MLRALGLASLVLSAVIFGGCGASSASTSMGAARAPRADNCALTLVTWQDVQPGGKYGDYEPVGMISVSARPGALATDPEVKNEVRPKACALGGELIAPMMSHTAQSRIGVDVAQRLAFTVYGKKAPSAPQKY